MKRTILVATSVLALAVSLSLSLALTTGCKKKEDKATDKPADGAKATEAGDSKAAVPDKTRKNDQKNCPSAVETAQTTVEKGEGVIVVTVTTERLSKVLDIRTRGAKLGELAAAKTASIEGLNKCPVVLEKAKLAAETLKFGTKLTITPDDPATLDALFTTLSAQAKDMNERGGVAHGSGAGMGKGAGEGGNKGGRPKDGKQEVAPNLGPGGKNPCDDDE